MTPENGILRDMAAGMRHSTPDEQIDAALLRKLVARLLRRHFMGLYDCDPEECEGCGAIEQCENGQLVAAARALGVEI